MLIKDTIIIKKNKQKQFKLISQIIKISNKVKFE